MTVYTFFCFLRGHHSATIRVVRDGKLHLQCLSCGQLTAVGMQP